MGRVCPICKGVEEQRSVQYVTKETAPLIVVENVPAWVCTQCGETVLEAPIADRVLRIVQADGKPARKMSVPVYDFTAVSEEIARP